MYVDPFLGDPPIQDDELNASYAFDPKHDYFADIELQHPAWRPPAVEYIPKGGAMASDAAFFDVGKPRELRVVTTDPATGKKTRKTQGMGHKRYVRAIDPAGNLCGLIISTIAPDREHPNGDDGLGTFGMVIQKKNNRGWIIVENDQGVWHPHSRRTGQDYCAWALAVQALRKKKHAEHEKREQTEWLEEKKREALAVARETAAITGQINAEAISAAMANVGKDIAASVASEVRKAKGKD